MTVLYLDASAWVKRYFQEDGTRWVTQQFDNGNLLGASTLGLIEVAATFARKRTAGALDSSRDPQIDIPLLEDWDAMFQVDLTAEAVAQSLNVATTCALRGADCTHLASAIILKERLALQTNEFALVTSDQELLTAALKFGLNVLDPVAEEAKVSAPPPSESE